MITLGIETSSNVGSVALLDDEHLLAEKTFERGMIHGRELAPSTQAVLVEQKLRVEQIDLIAVDVGPGSYTGLRVGLATAKGLAYALKKPLVGVISLDVMVENVLDVSAHYLCPIVDARWEQVYAVLYEKEGRGLKQIIPPLAEKPEAFAKRLPKEVLLFGDGLVRYETLFQKSGWQWGEKESWIPRAKNVVLLGFRQYQQGKRDDPFTLTPLYLRPTEAEVKFGQKKAVAEKTC